MKIRQRFNKDKIYFISDTHFHHSNIIEMCSRPWGDIKTHDNSLIQNWNNTVSKDGIVFLAGDVALTSRIDYITELIEQLNGFIYLIPGNHDIQNRFDREIIMKLFAGFYDTLSITVDDEDQPNGHVNFFISHYPHLFWQRGSYHLHGHVHSGPNSTANEKVPFHFMRYDIGVDNNNYKPISYYELMAIFEQYKIKEDEKS